MSDLDALLAGIVADPHDQLRWLIVADWLDDHGQPDRAELLRLHRMMIDTCCEPDAHPERAVWQSRIVELIDQGVKPCVPQHTLTLPGGVPLVGNFIPPGSFLMGSPEPERLRGRGELQYSVTLTKGFFLNVHPVSQSQWMAVMGANPSKFQALGGSLPVESVSWHDAVAFREKVSTLTSAALKLPTEAEWEYAARAGTTTPYYWPGEMDGTQANCWGQDPGGPDPVGRYPGKTTKAGSYADVAPHPLGLTDLLGNVLEWCADRFDTAFYSRSPVVDPECQDGGQELRSTRGALGSAFDRTRESRPEAVPNPTCAAEVSASAWPSP